MASNTSPPSGRLSFAKVAMMNPPLNEYTLATHQNMQSTELIGRAPTGGPPDLRNLRHTREHPQVDDVMAGVQSLRLVRRTEGPSGSEPPGGVDQLKSDGTFDDDQTHLSNSSTKPPSFDSKSMASVTTFALDEKESLRPDDSASVQAIEEDDYSGSASGAPGSQIGSETGARLNRISQMVISQRLPGATTDDISRLAVRESKILNGEPPLNILSEQILHGFPDEPDEKLFEAMRSPKDRLLILQLEEKIIAFIKNPSEQSLELPPCNAFGRLLAHKLGDYYHLTHFVDNNVTSVRLHRTPWCRLPTPLSAIYAATAVKTPPLAVPAMKIMRRVGQTGKSTSVGGSTAPSSSAPSKATSETGADGSGEDGTESSAAATPAKERQALTREEREAKYQEARERIFRDFPESKASDSPNSADQSADVSRSNSRTGRKKHRQRMPHDDTFEARSQFSAYYAGVQYPNTQMPFGGMVHEGPFASQNNYMVGHPNPAGMNFAHNTQTTGMYPPQTHANGFPQYPMALPPQSNWQNGHVPMPQFTNYQQGSQLPVMTQQQTTRSSPAMSSYSLPNGMQYPQSPPLWSQTPYQPNYPSSASQRNSQPVHWPNVPPNAMASTPVSYAYGQVQNQAYPQTSLNNSPQPVPGSYVRSNFNPQSRSFAPGGLSQQRFSETIAASQPSTTYSGVNSMWAGQENASRFLSKNHVNIKPPTSSAMGQCSSSPGRQMDNQNSIAKWGTPSHLPPKPPPSEIPYDFDRVARPSTVPSQTYSHNTANASRPGTSKSGPLVVGGSAHSNSHPHGASATAL